MRKWSDKSLAVLQSLDPRLQKVMRRVLDEVADISLLYGYRGEEEQNRLYDEGKSQLRYPQSKHNSFPSLAVDFAPYPYPRNALTLHGSLGYIAGAAMAIGREEGIALRWGGDWNRNGSLVDNRFNDLFHIEIHEP